MTKTITLDLDFETTTCSQCGLVFALTAAFYRELRKNAKTFYCPAGHGLWFGESEADRLRRQVRELEARSVHYRDQADAENRERRSVERQLAAQKGQATKLRKRIANGDCPCCHRKFADLARHMAGQHPDFVTAPTEDEGRDL